MLGNKLRIRLKKHHFYGHRGRVPSKGLESRESCSGVHKGSYCRQDEAGKSYWCAGYMKSLQLFLLLWLQYMPLLQRDRARHGSRFSSCACQPCLCAGVWGQTHLGHVGKACLCVGLALLQGAWRDTCWTLATGNMMPSSLHSRCLARKASDMLGQELLMDLLNGSIPEGYEELCSKFNLHVKHGKSLYAFTQKAFGLLSTKCREALGNAVKLQYVGSRRDGAFSRSSSDLDIWILPQEQASTKLTCEYRMVLQTLKEGIAALDFVQDIAIGEVSVKFKAVDPDIQLSISVDLALPPNDTEDFPQLRGKRSQQENDRHIDGYLIDHPTAGIAVSGIKQLLKVRPKGKLLKAMVLLVVSHHDFAVSNRNEHQVPGAAVNSEAFTLFLLFMKELQNWRVSPAFGLPLTTDLTGHPKRKYHIERFEKAAAAITSGSWVERLDELEIANGYIRNTRPETGKHPDRHCFFLPRNRNKKRGKYKYKCIWCHDYNKGVGLEPGDRCRKCKNSQVEHPQFQQKRQEVLQAQISCNEPVRGRYLTKAVQRIRLGPSVSMKSQIEHL